MCFNKAETLVNYSFGTCQQRKLFPHSYPPNFLGNKFLPLRGAPHRGPGCYTAENRYDWVYNLSKIPTSRKGYSFGARTAARFKPINKDVTPHPGTYQTVSLQERNVKQNFAPFNVMLPRFGTYSRDKYRPGCPRTRTSEDTGTAWPTCACFTIEELGLPSRAAPDHRVSWVEDRAAPPPLRSCSPLVCHRGPRERPGAHTYM
ncbi:protein pitchfork isoform X2 [Artibeus jamaicensis]|uniref:protein pitchfork isoform X2 n=1 Tax=Artibeus jamaicensis TaxID=9417 RepID=UPI00235AEA38|nr:protein pitchfork isoform X2 [Artibeus jamaicensis]